MTIFFVESLHVSSALSSFSSKGLVEVNSLCSSGTFSTVCVVSVDEVKEVLRVDVTEEVVLTVVPRVDEGEEVVELTEVVRVEGVKEMRPRERERSFGEREEANRGRASKAKECMDSCCLRARVTFEI